MMTDSVPREANDRSAVRRRILRQRNSIAHQLVTTRGAGEWDGGGAWNDVRDANVADAEWTVNSGKHVAGSSLLF